MITAPAHCLPANSRQILFSLHQYHQVKKIKAILHWALVIWQHQWFLAMRIELAPPSLCGRIWQLDCVSLGHWPQGTTPGILSCWHQLHNTKCALLKSAPQYKVCNGDTTYKLQYKVYKAAHLQYDAQFTKAYPVEISAVQCTMFYVKISIAVFVCIAVFVYLL